VGSGRELCGRRRNHGGRADQRLEEGGGANKRGPQDRDKDAQSRQWAEALTGGTQMAEGGGESARARELPLTGGAHLSGGEGARGPAGLGWAKWAEMDFSFSKDF
jgi:hypothetical protein